MQSSVSRGWKYLEQRFGVSREDLGDYGLREASGDLWLVSSDMDTELEVETYGIRFIRQMKIGLKPTTYGLQLLGDRIKKNIVEVDRKELKKLLRRKEMVERNLDEKGYIAIKYDSRVIGCGFYKDGKVSSRIPKGRGKELLEILSQ